MEQKFIVTKSQLLSIVKKSNKVRKDIASLLGSAVDYYYKQQLAYLDKEADMFKKQNLDSYKKQVVFYKKAYFNLFAYEDGRLYIDVLVGKGGVQLPFSISEKIENAISDMIVKQSHGAFVKNNSKYLKLADKTKKLDEARYMKTPMNDTTIAKIVTEILNTVK